MRSVNQNHHLYVAKSKVDTDGTFNTQQKAAGSGAIQVCVTDGATVDKDLFFKYVGFDGMVSSDLIPVNQISYIRYVPAAQMATKLRTATVKLNENPIVGQDYILNITFSQFYGPSPENTYVKTIAVRANSTNSVSKDAMYVGMINELNAAFSREVGATATENPYLEFSHSANGLVLTEKEQPWALGKWEAESLMFEVFPSTIYKTTNGVTTEETWGTVEYGVSNTTVPNSKKMADLEWFTFKERADAYGGMGYPNNFVFRPMVNPSNATGYGAIEIHFAYQGSCEDIQKSEKDITIIGSESVMNGIKGDIETALSITIPVVGETSQDTEQGGGTNPG